MEYQKVIEGTQIYKRLGEFELKLPQLQIPQGFATALIGENGAGKTTLLNILAGIRLNARGSITWFGNARSIDGSGTKERIGYTGTANYFLPGWTIRQVREVSALLFDSFHGDRFDRWCEAFAITAQERGASAKKISQLSEGTRMKLALACVLARDTELLLLDEPASPLDPLMREMLCDLLRTYIAEGDGARSILFSTHNITDMERATDYCIIMAKGQIAEEGFTEALKEKYVLVKGDNDTAARAKELLFHFSPGAYGYEGLLRSADLNRLAGMNVSTEVPTLAQISVAIMKRSSGLKRPA